MTARMRSLDALLARDRRLHGLRIGVHGEESRAHLRHAFDALLHGVADVVQLEVEKHLLAGGDEPAPRTAGRRRRRADSRSCRTTPRRRAARPWPRRRRPRAGRARRSAVRGREATWSSFLQHDLFRPSFARHSGLREGGNDHASHIIVCAISTSRDSCARRRLAVLASAILSMSSKA